MSILYLQCRTYGTVSVEVKKTQHKYIVGPRGQGLQEVLQTTGVWVEVPPSDSDTNTITLRGPQEKLGQALTVVNLLPHLSLSLSLSLSFLSLPPLPSLPTTVDSVIINNMIYPSSVPHSFNHIIEFSWVI